MSRPEDELPDPLEGAYPEEPGADDRTKGGFVPEFVRKVAVAGLGALFMTEEGIRSLAGQLKLPKEVLGFVVSQAEKTKDEVGRVLSEEMRRFLQSEKLRDEFLKLITGMTVEVKAQIRLLPREKEATNSPEEPAEGGVVPQIIVSELGAKRQGRKKE